MSDQECGLGCGVAIMALTAILIPVGIVLMVLAFNFLTEVRDFLRERYLDRNWEPIRRDLIFVPVWLIAEVTWLLIVVLVALATAYGGYQMAKGVRDWWHSGGR
jgi:hypothetical protein